MKNPNKKNCTKSISLKMNNFKSILFIKAWGNKENQPVLVTHGVQDNAGFFDYLIPNLPEIFYYICVDLPGHGKSSHFPPYIPIHDINYVYVYKLILDYLDRKKYFIIGHSFGGQVGLLFAHLFPEYITKLVVIDVLYFIRIPAKQLNKLNSIFDRQCNLNISSKQPIYSYDDIIEKYSENRRAGPIPIDKCHTIAKRSLIEVDKHKFKISTDPRLKAYVRPFWDHEFILEMINLNPFHCQVLIVLPIQTGLPVMYSKKFIEAVLDKWKNNKMVTIKNCKGNHDCHILEPESVGKVISEFLIKQINKL